MTPLGRLRQRVDLQAKVRTVSSSGSVSEAWTTFATVWARMEPLSSKEVMAAGRAVGEIVYRVEVRFRSDLDEAERLIWNGKNHDIVPPRNTDERNQRLVFLAVERRA
jgi:SPP1 family predicted phage head-tail adaptor